MNGLCAALERVPIRPNVMNDPNSISLSHFFRAASGRHTGRVARGANRPGPHRHQRREPTQIYGESPPLVFGGVALAATEGAGSNGVVASVTSGLRVGLVVTVDVPRKAGGTCELGTP